MVENSFIIPYMHEFFSLEEGRDIVLRAETLHGDVFNMQMGLPVEGEELIKIGQKDLFIYLDENSGNVHIRRYWMNKEGEMKPHKRGCCLSLEEFTNFLMTIPNVVERATEN